MTRQLIRLAPVVIPVQELAEAIGESVVDGNKTYPIGADRDAALLDRLEQKAEHFAEQSRRYRIAADVLRSSLTDPTP